MKMNIKIFLATFMFVVLPVTAWRVIDVIITDTCDPKFGCIGGLQFGILIQCICGFVSGFASLLTCYIFRNKLVRLSQTSLFGSLLISGTFLSFSSFLLLSVSHTIPAMFGTWFVVSMVVISFCLGIAFITNGCCATLKTSRAKPER